MRSRPHQFRLSRPTRCVSVFLLVFLSLFLNVVVPGHARGIVTLSGKQSVSKLSDLACPLCAGRATKDPKNAPTKQDQADCAICSLAMRVTTCQPIDLRLDRLSFLEFSPPPVQLIAAFIVPTTPHFSRGPPDRSV